MFDEIQFEKINQLPKYVFAAIDELKAQAKEEGRDVVDFSMGNPDQDTPPQIVEALVEHVRKNGTHGYSAGSGKGLLQLREAICNWYKRKYDVDLDPEREAVATMGSKDGFFHMVQAVTNPGDIALVPDPTYPIHAYAFSINGAKPIGIKIPFNETNYEVDEAKYLEMIESTIDLQHAPVKYVLVNFPHNPSTATVTLDFYEKLVALAKKKRFYVISDIAYADIAFDGYKSPSILQVEGAKDVAVEAYTLSKSYNMAGWRVGFLVGNKSLVGALQKLKSWIDYGMFTPVQLAAADTLNKYYAIADEETAPRYQRRRDYLVKAFNEAGWKIGTPKASMFIWARIPEQCMHMGSLKFSEELIKKADMAVSPGVAFGDDSHVRIALIADEDRIQQAADKLKVFLEEMK
jgi:alanine-synthesizing transaminase